MTYPTLKEIDAADRLQLGRWYRFLPMAETPDQVRIIDRLYERFMNEMGGFTPEISKAIGWEDE